MEYAMKTATKYVIIIKVYKLGAMFRPQIEIFGQIYQL
jgi:hypothetical protein